MDQAQYSLLNNKIQQMLNGIRPNTTCKIIKTQGVKWEYLMLIRSGPIQLVTKDI